MHVCGMTHSCAWHASFMTNIWLFARLDFRVWLIYIVDIGDVPHSYGWHDSFTCVAWRVHIYSIAFHMCDLTCSYVWHDTFICVAWLMRTCCMTCSYVRHNSFVCVTWRIQMYHMAHSNAQRVPLRICWWLLIIVTQFHVCRDAVICVVALCVTRLAQICCVSSMHVTRLACAWYESFICVKWRICLSGVTQS